MANQALVKAAGVGGKACEIIESGFGRDDTE
jgi:hypothetical protein